MASLSDVAGETQRALLDEQISYYDARAAEYDDWHQRLGRYDRGAQATASWNAEMDEVREALRGLALDDAHLLEFAPGTGLWTQVLCERARSVVGVDASREMVAVARRRLGASGAKVDFVHADIFTWRPSELFDGVVFGFWISHVPAEGLDEFIETVAAALRPGGFVFFVDSRREQRSTAVDHVLPGEGEQTMTRRLDDGRQFHIVKNFWDASELEARFARCGVALSVRQTETYFQYGVGHLARSTG